MDVARFVAVAAEYPPPPAAAGSAAPMRFAYGTAGFRTAGHLLRSTVFRCGALAAVRSAVTGGAALATGPVPAPVPAPALASSTWGLLFFLYLYLRRWHALGTLAPHAVASRVAHLI